MLLLALDTSTRQSSVALCTEEQIYGEATWYAGGNHSVELFDHIQRLTSMAQVTMAQIDTIAVATGPGSFNGVRVALATARALSFSLEKTLVGISTLDCCAMQQMHWQGPLCAVLEAGRSELYAACYQFENQFDAAGLFAPRLQRLSDYVLLSPQGLAQYLQEQAGAWFGVPGEREVPPFLFCGEISAASREALRSSLQEHALFVGAMQSPRRATGLALLALQRLREGSADDPLSLEPLYLRRPSITTSTRKQPLLGGATQRGAGQHTTEREEGALRH